MDANDPLQQTWSLVTEQPQVPKGVQQYSEFQRDGLMALIKDDEDFAQGEKYRLHINPHTTVELSHFALGNDAFYTLELLREGQDNALVTYDRSTGEVIRRANFEEVQSYMPLVFDRPGLPTYTTRELTDLLSQPPQEWTDELEIGDYYPDVDAYAHRRL